MTTNSQWHYKKDDTVLGPYTPVEIKQFIDDGIIDGNTYVFEDSSDDWALMSEKSSLLTAQISRPDNPPQDKTQTNNKSLQPLKSNTVLRYLIEALFWPQITYYSLMGVAVLRADGVEKKEGFLSLEDIESVIMAFAAFTLLGIIVFLIFIYRANSNAIKMNKNHGVKSWVAVVWYLTPIAWFWMPYLTMKKIWSSSNGDTHENKGLVFVWWIGFLIWGWYEFIPTILEELSFISSENSVLKLNIFAGYYIVSAMSMYIAILLVRELTELQKNKL